MKKLENFFNKEVVVKCSVFQMLLMGLISGFVFSLFTFICLTFYRDALIYLLEYAENSSNALRVALILLPAYIIIELVVRLGYIVSNVDFREKRNIFQKIYDKLFRK